MKYTNKNNSILSGGMCIPVVEGNRHYAAILAEVEAGEAEIVAWEGSDDKEAEDLLKHVASLEAYIEEHIQKPITDYNNNHGLAFGGVHNCANYLNNPEYTHYDFCLDVWNFNVDVWESARGTQDDVQNGTISMPSLDTFKTMLPIYMGTT